MLIKLAMLSIMVLQLHPFHQTPRRILQTIPFMDFSYNGLVFMLLRGSCNSDYLPQATKGLDLRLICLLNLRTVRTHSMRLSDTL